MQFQFKGVAINSVAVVLPDVIRKFDDDVKNFDFPIERSMKLKSIMGYDQHQVVSEGVTSSDLALFGIRKLVEENLIQLDEIDALIYVTQSPDYFMPPTSSVIHGALGLGEEVYCVDLNQGCAGFVIGLIEGFSLIDSGRANKVLLINSDVISRKVSVKDRNSYPLIGDAASITLLEAKKGSNASAIARFDGKSHEALIIPAGGFRTPSTSETAELVNSGDGNWRSQDNLRMDGSAVFNFVQTKVPELIEDLFSLAGVSDKDVDCYAFHQPNRFMLEKLADKMEVSRQKMPNNVVEQFGNTSSVTIPMAIIEANSTINNPVNFCFAGFGVGLTWAAMYLSSNQIETIVTYRYSPQQSIG